MKTIIARTRADASSCRPDHNKTTRRQAMEFDPVLLPPRRADSIARGWWHDRTINDELDACVARFRTSWR